MKQLLFIGLGRMGAPMAGHLAKRTNISVSVYNRSKNKITQWLERYPGRAHAAEQKYDALVLCVGGDEDVRENLAVDGALINCLKPGGLVIDHTTTSAELAKAMSQQLAKAGMAYLDAPVSGGEAGAIKGQLSCMVGGEEKAFQQAGEIVNAYCHQVVRIGPSGAGQIAKMANQLCIAGILAGLSEAIYLIEKAGVDANKVYQAIGGGAAQSWQLDNRFQTMVSGDYDFGFAIEHMIKDLDYALAETQRQGWKPPVTQKVLNDYRHLLAEGKSGQDTSVLLENYRQNN